VAAHAFPGAVLAVGKDGVLAHLQPFGRLSYDEDAAPVRADTMYDLASLTKVIVTTTMAMILVDEGKLDIAKPVSAFLPEFRGGAKDKVTVWHLLTHSSGVDWWAPLYKDLKGKDAYLKRVLAMDLVYEPGSKSVYSDLGVLLLGEILERVAGQDINSFARARLFGPLGMKDTTYLPGPELLPRIAPTENDPWRGHVLRGEVHDENAAALGGIAPHAGLFGTAPDLARFAQMLLNGGELDGKRVLKAKTVQLMRTNVLARDAMVDLYGPSEGGVGFGMDFAIIMDPKAAKTPQGVNSFYWGGAFGTWFWIDPTNDLVFIGMIQNLNGSRPDAGTPRVRPLSIAATYKALTNPKK
jgi:CubicO group peptidase (beta-lactamase class C family)